MNLWRNKHNAVLWWRNKWLVLTWDLRRRRKSIAVGSSSFRRCRVSLGRLNVSLHKRLEFVETFACVSRSSSCERVASLRLALWWHARHVTHLFRIHVSRILRRCRWRCTQSLLVRVRLCVSRIVRIGVLGWVGVIREAALTPEAAPTTAHAPATGDARRVPVDVVHAVSFPDVVILNLFRLLVANEVPPTASHCHEEEAENDADDTEY